MELLIVLAIWSVLILLTAPMNFIHLEEEQERQFLEILEFDILYMQSLSTATKETIELVISKDHYTIYRGYKGEKLITRNIPSGWDIPTRLLDTITFDSNGRIKQPGHFMIMTKHAEYKVIFPFGKGRCYFVKQ